MDKCIILMNHSCIIPLMYKLYCFSGNYDISYMFYLLCTYLYLNDLSCDVLKMLEIWACIHVCMYEYIMAKDVNRPSCTYPAPNIPCIKRYETFSNFYSQLYWTYIADSKFGKLIKDACWYGRACWKSSEENHGDMADLILFLSDSC